MANLNKVVYLTEAQKNTLFTNGSITANGITVTYNPNDLYITPETYDTTPTSGSTNLITSGAVYTALSTINLTGTTNSATTGITISNHSTDSVIGVTDSTTTASKVTLGTAKSVPNVTAVGSGSFTQGSFNGGSLTMAIDGTDSKKLNITFTAATHGTDTHVHTPPTLGTAISIPNVTAATDVTVPIKGTLKTFVTSATHTITDNGHTHTYGSNS